MLTGIELALFLFLNLTLTLTAAALCNRHLRRKLTIRRRLAG